MVAKAQGRLGVARATQARQVWQSRGARAGLGTARRRPRTWLTPLLLRRVREGECVSVSGARRCWYFSPLPTLALLWTELAWPRPWLN